MAYLVAAVVIVGLLGLVNMVFSFGVIRRLREHTEILNELRSGATHATMLSAGETIAAFEARSIDGEPVSSALLRETTLVGVFSAGCSPCKEQLPRFVERARAHPGGRERVLAVVVSADDAAAAPYLDDLTGVATIVREADDGPVANAMGVKGFPAVSLIAADGLVLASGLSVAAIEEPARA
jgi:hypothetical protein